MCVLYFFPVGRYPTIQKKQHQPSNRLLCFHHLWYWRHFHRLGWFHWHHGLLQWFLRLLGLVLGGVDGSVLYHQQMPWFESQKNNSTAHGLCTKVFRQKHLKILYQIYWKLIHRHYCKCCIVHVWRVQWSSWLRCSPSLQTHPVLALHPSPWP